MRIVILGGSGTVGSAVAWDLARDPEVEAVNLIGVSQDSLEKVRNWLGSPKVTCQAVAGADGASLVAALNNCEVGVLALPDRKADYLWVEHALAAGLPCADVLEDCHRNPEPHEMEQLQAPRGMSLPEYGESPHWRAMDRGITFLDGIGFALGLSNITMGQGICQLDVAETAIARRRHPFQGRCGETFRSAA